MKTTKKEGGFVPFDDLGGADPAIDPALQSIVRQSQDLQTERRMSREEREQARKQKERLDRKKAREKAKIKARHPHRATYDLPEGMKAVIEAAAEEHSVTASQLVSLLLAVSLDSLGAGQIELASYKMRSESHRYDFKLEIPSGWRDLPQKMGFRVDPKKSRVDP